MAEIKIEIKSILGNVLFKYSKENNTFKDTVEEAVRRGANLDGANLDGANLVGANLYGANLYGANLRNANLDGANLRNANLDGANLDGANLDGANLDGASLVGANLYGANLYGANLRNANLDGANLRNANLDGEGMLSSSEDILLVGNIGSRQGYTIIYNTDKGIFVKCGCFFGTIVEFEAKVEQKHKGTRHERDYKALVEFAKIKFTKYE